MINIPLLLDMDKLFIYFVLNNINFLSFYVYIDFYGQAATLPSDPIVKKSLFFESY